MTDDLRAYAKVCVPWLQGMWTALQRFREINQGPELSMPGGVQQALSQLDIVAGITRQIKNYEDVPPGIDALHGHLHVAAGQWDEISQDYRRSITRNDVPRMQASLARIDAWTATLGQFLEELQQLAQAGSNDTA